MGPPALSTSLSAGYRRDDFLDLEEGVPTLSGWSYSGGTWGQVPVPEGDLQTVRTSLDGSLGLTAQRNRGPNDYGNMTVRRQISSPSYGKRGRDIQPASSGVSGTEGQQESSREAQAAHARPSTAWDTDQLVNIEMSGAVDTNTRGGSPLLVVAFSESTEDGDGIAPAAVSESGCIGFKGEETASLDRQEGLVSVLDGVLSGQSLQDEFSHSAGKGCSGMAPQEESRKTFSVTSQEAGLQPTAQGTSSPKQQEIHGEVSFTEGSAQRQRTSWEHHREERDIPTTGSTPFAAVSTPFGSQAAQPLNKEQSDNQSQATKSGLVTSPRGRKQKDPPLVNQVNNISSVKSRTPLGVSKEGTAPSVCEACTVVEVSQNSQPFRDPNFYFVADGQRHKRQSSIGEEINIGIPVGLSPIGVSIRRQASLPTPQAGDRIMQPPFWPIEPSTIQGLMDSDGASKPASPLVPGRWASATQPSMGSIGTAASRGHPPRMLTPRGGKPLDLGLSTPRGSLTPKQLDRLPACPLRDDGEAVLKSQPIDLRSFKPNVQIGNRATYAVHQVTQVAASPEQPLSPPLPINKPQKMQSEKDVPRQILGSVSVLNIGLNVQEGVGGPAAEKKQGQTGKVMPCTPPKGPLKSPRPRLDVLGFDVADLTQEIGVGTDTPRGKKVFPAVCVPEPSCTRTPRQRQSTPFQNYKGASFFDGSRKCAENIKTEGNSRVREQISISRTTSDAVHLSSDVPIPSCLMTRHSSMTPLPLGMQWALEDDPVAYSLEDPPEDGSHNVTKNKRGRKAVQAQSHTVDFPVQFTPVTSYKDEVRVHQKC